MPDRHKTTPKAVRMPGGLLPRVETAAERAGETVNAFIVGAIEERVERCESRSATVKPATAPAAPIRAAHAPTCKCGICKPPENGVQ